jgi:transposase-like protein
MAKRKRRAFTNDFKAEAVRVVRESGKTVGAVARELDLTETALRDWVRRAAVDADWARAGALTIECGPSWRNCGWRNGRCGWSATS